MSALTNVSFDGSPVQVRLDSPLIACFDPLALDYIGSQLADLSGGGLFRPDQVLERMNAHYPAMSCYQVADFQPGLYTLDPRDIQKFGDEKQDLDYSESQEEEESDRTDDAVQFPFVAVDSGALIFADFSHLSQLVERLTWEQYNLGFRDEAVFSGIAEAIGGPFFAVILGGCMPGMQFDGDGTYTIRPGAVTPVSG